MKKDSNMTMNVDESDTQQTVRFADADLKEKEKTTNTSTLSASKIKNVWLTDILYHAAKENSTQVIQKMLCVIISDIIIEDILTSELIVHKLMFKPGKSDIIAKIPNIEKVSVNSIQLCQLKNVLDSSVSLRAAVNVDKKQVSALIDSEVKVNLVEKEVLKKLNISYSIDCHLKLIDINSEETILHSIVENVSIWIDSVCVIQSLLIVEKASQLMILDMSYVSVTFMIIRVYSNDKVDVKIMSSQSDRHIQF